MSNQDPKDQVIRQLLGLLDRNGDHFVADEVAPNVLEAIKEHALSLLPPSMLCPVVDGSGMLVGYAFFCPACKCSHQFRHIPWINVGGGPGPVWEFNNDETAPTVNPSIKVSCKYQDHEDICHMFIRAGKIEYCGDCTHELSGQTVDMVVWREREAYLDE